MQIGNKGGQTLGIKRLIKKTVFLEIISESVISNVFTPSIEENLRDETITTRNWKILKTVKKRNDRHTAYICENTTSDTIT